MQLLESAMAFAVVMILLSTIVTGVVELLLRVVGLREKTLRNTVASLFESVVWPRLHGRLEEVLAAPEKGAAAGESAKKAALANFLDGMTANPALPAQAAETSGRWSRLFAWLPNFSHKDKIDVLTPLAFAERLARTDVGRAIVAEAEEEIEMLVKDFVRTFDRFGRAASEVFRKNAKQAAIAVGILLALIANIDASRLFTTLMNNPDLRTSLIAQADEAAAANQAAAEKLKAVMDQVAAGDLSEDQAEPIKAKVAEIRAGIGVLEQQGLPIGHGLFPYCGQGPSGDARCPQGKAFWTQPVELLRWLLFTILAGVLIGLGGPFWFRVFSSLSQLAQVLRSVGVGGRPAKPEELVATSEAEASAKPANVLDAFKVAAHVYGGQTVSSG